MSSKFTESTKKINLRPAKSVSIRKTARVVDIIPGILIGMSHEYAWSKNFISWGRRKVAFMCVTFGIKMPYGTIKESENTVQVAPVANVT